MNRAMIIGISAVIVGCAAPIPTGTPLSSSPTALAAPSSSTSSRPSASPVPTPAAGLGGSASSQSAEMAVASAYLASISTGNLKAAAALIGPSAKARTSSTASYQTLADAAAALAFVR